MLHGTRLDIFVHIFRLHKSGEPHEFHDDQKQEEKENKTHKFQKQLERNAGIIRTV